jgi:hypothetical protein
MGASVGEAARGLTTWLSVAADVGRGATVAKSMAYRNVLQCAQELCDASTALGKPIFFDIYAASASAWVFQTYAGQRGVDRTATGPSPLIVSEESGMLSDPALREDYSNEVTYCYAAGNGVGTARVIGTAPSASSSEVARLRASPFNRREAFADARKGYTTTTGCAYEAETYLRSQRPRRVFSGTLIDTPQYIYGVLWGWGDKVTATFDGTLIDCHVSQVTIDVSSGGERIAAVLRAA